MTVVGPISERVKNKWKPKLTLVTSGYGTPIHRINYKPTDSWYDLSSMYVKMCRALLKEVIHRNFNMKQ